MAYEQLEAEERAIVNMALGRLFRIMSRPFQDGDVEQFEMCRRTVLDVLNPPPFQPVISWARDRLKGAQGD